MRALIIGSGCTVYADLVAAEQWAFDARIGVNQAAIDFGPVDWHVTMHPREYAHRKAAPLVSFHAFAGVDLVHPWQWPDGPANSGSSGLYAVKFALEHLQASEVILAGVPIDPGPHYYGSDGWQAAIRFRRAWEFATPTIKGRVRSLSGWTRELLGDPEG